MQVRGTGLSTTVFNDPGDESTVLDCGPEHFRDGFLFKYAFLLSFNRQTDIDRAAFCRENLNSKTALGQIDLTRICVVELDSRS